MKINDMPCVFCGNPTNCAVIGTFGRFEGTDDYYHLVCFEMIEDEKCECGIIEGGKVFVCPMHYRRLLQDSNLNYLFYEGKMREIPKEDT